MEIDLMRKKSTLLFIFTIILLFRGGEVLADNDSIGKDKKTYIVEAGLNAGTILKFDDEVKQYLDENRQKSYLLSLGYRASVRDTSWSDYAYNYPTLSAGIGFVDAHKIRMFNAENKADYQSRMGNALSFTIAFRRRFWECGNFSADYVLENGIAYNSHSYNPKNDIDNTLIGSRYSVFVGFAAYLNYRLDRFEIGVGPQFNHLSNGGTDRPNKGANMFGLGVKARYYCDDYERGRQFAKPNYDSWKPYFYPDVSFGVGLKSLISAYEHQEAKNPVERNYSNFSVYPTYNVSVDLMYKYTFRYAVGLGVDCSYAPCNNKINDIDRATGVEVRDASPWYVGVSAKHEASYKNLSVNVALGFYLQHQTGYWEHKYEQFYYEFLGVRYRIPKAGGLYAGYHVKAHLGKADQLEFRLGMELGKHKNDKRQ